MNYSILSALAGLFLLFCGCVHHTDTVTTSSIFQEATTTYPLLAETESSGKNPLSTTTIYQPPTTVLLITTTQLATATQPALTKTTTTSKATTTTFSGSVYFSEEEIKQAKMPYAVDAVVAVDGKLAYTLNTGEASSNGLAKYVIYYDGIELGRQYETVSYPKDLGGKLAYQARQGGKDFIVYDGKEYGKEYVWADNPVVVDDKLVYMAYQGGIDQKTVLVYDGVERNVSYNSSNSEEIIGLENVNGKLAYRVGKISAGQVVDRVFIVYEGKEYGREYGEADNPAGVGGKLAYVGRWGQTEFLVYDGKEGEVHPSGSIISLKDVNGKPAYIVQSSEYLVYGDEKIGNMEDYLNILEPVGVDGLLVYASEKEGRDTWTINYGGKEIDNGYTYIAPNPLNIGGKLVFVADKGGKTYIVRQK